MKKFIDANEIREVAKGNWPSILQAAGIPAELLDTHKHQPCPACGGTDRYRFTDYKGSGVWICNQCHPDGGSPFDLLNVVCGYSFNEAKDVLAEVLGLSHNQDIERKVAKTLPTPIGKVSSSNDKWLPILPVPDYALKSMNFKNKYRNEKPIFTSIFRGKDGAILGGVARFIKTDGRKLDLPYTFCRHVDTGVQEWRWRCWENPRPLYGLDELSAKSEAVVLVVEGEKCKNTADHANLPVVTVTWHGGCKNWDKTDWSPIKNRRVILWADADAQREPLSRAERELNITPESKPLLSRYEQGGMKAMLGIAEILSKQGCEVFFVNIPEPNVWPAGYDIADALADKEHKYIDVHHALSRKGWADWLIDYSSILKMMESSSAPTSNLVTHAETNAVISSNEQQAQQDTTDNNLQTLLYGFALIEGKTKAVDKKNAVEYSRSALIARFGKDVVDEWYSSSKKSVFTQHEVNKMKKDRELLIATEQPEVQEMMERYIYLDGSSSIWDNTLWRIIDQGSAKMAMADGFKVWANSPLRKVKRIDHVVFEPGREMPEYYINIFRGMPLKGKAEFPIPLEEMPKWWLDVIRLYPKCRAIQKLIAHLCNNDMLQIEFVYNWLAYPLQHVGAKMNTALVFHGDVHGAGKSFLFEEIIRPIYGDYAATLGQTDLDSPYTGNRSGKLFILFEEIFNNKQKYDQTGAMKHMITGKTMRIERKFVDSYEEANHINCVFLSNEPQPFKIEENDRRYFVVWPKNKLPDNLKEELLEEIGNGGIEEFYQLLLSLPLTLNYEYETLDEPTERINVVMRDKPIRFDAKTEAPMTQAKKNVIIFGRYAWQTFYAEWAAGEINGMPYCSCIAEDLWELYKWWCRKHNEREMSRTKFLQHIASKMPKARRWWRLPNSAKPTEKTQDTIFNRPNVRTPDGMAEMDFIGPQVIQFKSALRNLLNI